VIRNSKTQKAISCSFMCLCKFMFAHYFVCLFFFHVLSFDSYLFVNESYFGLEATCHLGNVMLLIHVCVDNNSCKY